MPFLGGWLQSKASPLFYHHVDPSFTWSSWTLDFFSIGESSHLFGVYCTWIFLRDAYVVDRGDIYFWASDLYYIRCQLHMHAISSHSQLIFIQRNSQVFDCKSCFLCMYHHAWAVSSFSDRNSATLLWGWRSSCGWWILCCVDHKIISQSMVFFSCTSLQTPVVSFGQMVDLLIHSNA